jgi:CheY-like chemotaxis protein
MTDPQAQTPPAPTLRERFLQAAQEILREPDTPLDLRKVAERAGKSRTAPYLVFGKESEGGGLLALKIAVAAEGAREMADRMEEARDESSEDSLEAFEAVAHAFLTFVEENRRLFRLMYGPEINAVSRLGKEGFREHPEFSRLLAERDRAGLLVGSLIWEAQRRHVLQPDPLSPDQVAHPDGEAPSQRYLQVAWAAMIGVAHLRDDELLQAIGWDITRDNGSRLITEAVFGLDPKRAEEAANKFLRSRGVLSAGRPVRAEASTRLSAPPAPTPSPPKRSPPGRRSRREAMLRPDRLEAAEVAPVAPVRRPIEHIAKAITQEDLPPEPGPDEELTLSEALTHHSGLRRAVASQSLLSRTHILWVDDHPQWIENEVATFRALGAQVTVASATEQALEAVAGDERFDVLISDIARGNQKLAGVRAVPAIHELAPGLPILFFVGDYRPELGVPADAAGITNRTDELLHLVLDVLERR